jgi:hypothetical protein
VNQKILQVRDWFSILGYTILLTFKFLRLVISSLGVGTGIYLIHLRVSSDSKNVPGFVLLFFYLGLVVIRILVAIVV